MSTSRLLAGTHHVHSANSHLVLAVLLALAAALVLAVATVAQQRSAAESTDSDARSGQFIGQLLRNPRWLLSNVGTGAAYALQALALSFGSVLVVQPLLVTSLVFALPLSAHFEHRRPSLSAFLWGTLLGAALAVFVVLGNPNSGRSHAPPGAWALAAAVGVPVVVVCLITAHSRSGTVRAALLAIPTGVLGGALAVLTKAVVGTLSNHPAHVLISGEFYALLVVGGAGIYLQQLAFQAGALRASLPIITVLEPVVAAALGLTLLHEQLRASGGRLAVLVVAAMVMAVATVLLSRGQVRPTPADA